ncbi:MAG: PEP/pyruvate-binding domain-containing protein [Nanoarchaeota archaeon]
MKYILFFSESGQADIKYIGKKGVNLALLFKKGFKVPPGFILSREIFDEIVNHKQIKGAVHELFKCSEDKFKEKAKEVRALISNYVFHEEIEEEIIEAYLSLSIDFNMSVTSMLESEEVFVGVRHSFVGEELENPKLIQTTILNVKGKERLFKAILGTYVDKLIQYLHNFRERKIKPDFSIALIIQKMVDAEKSGIAFQEGENIIVKASFGLGGDFDSGNVFPDTYVVDSKTFSVKDMKIVDKQFEYVKDIDSNDTVKHRLGERSNKPALFDAEIAEIARILKRVSSSFEKQQQIEWSKKKDTIYVMKTKDKKEHQQETVQIEVYDEEPEILPETIDISEPNFEEDLQVLEEIEEYEKGKQEITIKGPEEKIGEDMILDDLNLVEKASKESPEIEEIDIAIDEPEKNEQDKSIFSDYKGYDNFDAVDKVEESMPALDKLSELAKMNSGNTVVYCYMSIKEKLRQKLHKYVPKPPEEYYKLLTELKEYEPLKNENELRRLGDIQQEFVSKLKYPEPEDVGMALKLLDSF